MPIPQVTERLKEAPAVALRAVFAGVGQLLLAADKIRGRALGQFSPAGQGGQAERERVKIVPAQEAARKVGEERAARRATAAPSPAPAAGAAPPAPAATAAPPPPAAAVAEGERAAAAGAEPAPIPGYDDLSIASLRARMRVLDAAALRSLLDYERAHACRDTVIAMFERRLAKITSETG